MARTRRKRAAEQSRAAGRAVGGAILAGVIYDIAKGAAKWSWTKARSARKGSPA
jgi:hypothetical protein